NRGVRPWHLRGCLDTTCSGRPHRRRTTQSSQAAQFQLPTLIERKAMMLQTRDHGLTPLRRLRPGARGALRVSAIALAAALAAAVLDPSGALAAGNMLQNSSLETASGTTPSCWMLGGYGTNTYAWTHTTDSHTGSYAENLNITRMTSGDRKLLSAFDS